MNFDVSRWKDDEHGSTRTRESIATGAQTSKDSVGFMQIPFLYLENKKKQLKTTNRSWINSATYVRHVDGFSSL